MTHKTPGRRMSKKNRREAFIRTSASRAAAAAGRKAWFELYGGLCMNGCGRKGPHYVPASFGDPGFFICDVPFTPTEDEFDSLPILELS